MAKLPQISNKTAVFAAVSVGFGLLFGALRPAFMQLDDLAALVAALQVFVADFDADALGFGAFAESMLRYGRLPALIWACAAFPKAFYAGYLVLYLHAMTLGFSAAMMVQAFGGRGFGMTLGLYAVQNLIILPICAYTIDFLAKKQPHGLSRDVIKTAAMGILCVIFVSVLEVYVVPRFFEMMR